MKLGVHLGYWGLGITGEQQLEMAREAEKLGFDSAWTAEAYGSDAATVLAWIAGSTEKIKLGSAIFQMPARTPAMTAMTAATLDNISEGRFILGLGMSGPQVVEGWHGQPFRKQLKTTREYVEIMRKALDRERLEYDGEIYKLPLPGGRGKALKLIIEPVQDRIPIYIAANGPKNVALTAEIADGWLPTIFAPEKFDIFKPSLEEGAERGGRSLDDLAIVPSTQVCIGEDIDMCRNFMRPFLALYIGGMGSREKNFYKELVTRYGFGDEAQRVQELYLDHKQAEAMAEIPAELIDMTTLCGPPERIKERLEAYDEVGTDTIIVTPVAATPEERLKMMGELAELAA